MDNELYKQFKEFNEENAIKKKMSTVLPEILNMLNKTELSGLATMHGLQGRSKMNKSQLAAALADSITNPDHIENGIVLMEDEEWELLLEYIKGTDPETDQILYGSYAYAKAQCWLFSFYFDNSFHIIMPDEVREAFTQMDLELLNEKRQQYRFVIDYIHALVNLNGIVPLLDVYKVIQLQNPGRISESEFLSIVEQLPERQWSFDFFDGLFVDGSIEDSDELDALLTQTKGKPQYLPPKEQLLLYKNDAFFEMTPELIALCNYISKELCQDPEVVTNLIDDIQFACSMESSLQDIMYEFENKNINFEHIEQVNTVVSLVTDVMNNTRLWSNRGYTPTELYELTKEDSAVKSSLQPYRVLVNQQATSVKVGRNEPCVCGSGKKYKKCCGNS